MMRATDQKFAVVLALLFAGALHAGEVGAPAGSGETGDENVGDPPPPPVQASQPPLPPAEKPRFNIWEYRIESNTLLAGQMVERAVYPHLGPGKTIDDVEAARGSLESLYRSQGFGTVLVNIPEQDVKEGIVRLEVVEGKVDRLRVTGSRYFSLGRIKQAVPALAEGNVPHFPTVQQELAALGQESADRRVTPVLRPGKKTGTVEVELKVKDKLPIHADVQLNNNRSADTEDLRLLSSIRYDNLWQAFHSFSLQYQTAPQAPEQVRTIAGTYMLPFGDAGGRLALYGVLSDSDVPSSSPFSDSVIGDGRIAGARAIWPLPAMQGYFHHLSLGADYKEFKDRIAVGSASLDTPIDYHTFSARYGATTLGEGTRTQFNLGPTLAFRGLGNSQEEFANKRFKAEPGFFYLRGDVEHRRKLGKGWSFTGSVDMQWADAPLISNEQFSAGGADSVRGYLVSQALGDSGVRVNLELHSPQIRPFADGLLTDLHMLAFLDAARLWVREPLPGERLRFTLISGGLGLRLSTRAGLSARLGWAWPFRDAPDSTEPVEAGDSRVHLQLDYEI